MTIPSFKILKKNASERVSAAEQSGRIALIYGGAVTLLAILTTLINHTLKLQIAQTGGLSNMGLRTMLSTIQSVVPMVQNFLVMCLDLGYIAAMLRIARQQYASPQTLKLGFDRFWVMLRYTLIQSGIYLLAAFAASWIGVQIFLFTPLSRPVMELLSPYLSDPNLMTAALTKNQALMDQLLGAMLPLLLGVFVLYLVIYLPIGYSLRMSRYVIIDQPAQGAMFAIRESRKMMKGSRMRLFRLDVSLWWWYAISFGATLLCYGDMLLPLVGIELPWPADFSYYLFYGLYLAVQLAACCFLRNRVEVVYGQVYNALKPREVSGGVVLGNIFQM